METAAETEIGRLARRAAKFKRDRERLESYVLAVLDAWGVDAFAWFETPAGRFILTKIVSIAFICLPFYIQT